MRTILPRVLSSVLGVRPPDVAFAESDEQPAVTREHQPRSEVMAALHRRLLAEDDLHAGELAALEHAARDRGSVASLAGLRVGQVDEAVLREGGVERHVEQAALPLGLDRRHSGNRRTHLAVALDESQTRPGVR